MSEGQDEFQEFLASQRAKYGDRPAPPGHYLGDGLYGAFDGYQVELFAHNGISKTQRVFLDPAVLGNFEKWCATLKPGKESPGGIPALPPIVTPQCPGCGQRPGRVLDEGRQAFCFNDDCSTLAWNPFEK